MFAPSAATMAAEQPWWFYALGAIALVVLIGLLWRSRSSLRGDPGEGYPETRREDTSADPGPKIRVREFLDPHAGTRGSRKSPDDAEHADE